MQCSTRARWLPALQVLPSREAIDEVERIAGSFWGEHPDQYIAIHCAYGEAAPAHQWLADLSPRLPS